VQDKTFRVVLEHPSDIAKVKAAQKAGERWVGIPNPPVCFASARMERARRELLGTRIAQFASRAGIT
jgi:hypothetical protein